MDQDVELASISGYAHLSPRAIAAQTAGADADGAAYLKRLIAKCVAFGWLVLGVVGCLVLGCVYVD